MKLYLEMLKKPVFTLEDAMSVGVSSGTIKNQLVKLVTDGYVERIRRNLYTCISPETKLPIANKYQIASAITKDSFASHHSALEYYGVADQVYYDVYVSSKTKFQNFDYNGYTYKCILVKKNMGVAKPVMKDGICVSSPERAVVESIKDMDKISGVEEVIASIVLFPMLDENKMLECLEGFDNQFLYQKVGFIMEHFKEQFSISDDFIAICKDKAGQSKRYFTKDMKCTIWNREWKIVIPEKLFEMKNGENV